MVLQEAKKWTRMWFIFQENWPTFLKLVVGNKDGGRSIYG